MSQSRTSSPKKTAPQSPKALRPWAILAVAAVILLIGFVYFPLYNQPGLHTAAGFFPETETGVYSAGGASITTTSSGGTKPFTPAPSPFLPKTSGRSPPTAPSPPSRAGKSPPAATPSPSPS